MTAPIGIAESVRTVDGETIATVRLGASTDADVEHLRRAMVEAHQTWQAILSIPARTVGDIGALDRYEQDAFRVFADAGRAWVAAKRARGGL